ncbi:MAG: hypothetical protein ACI83Y_001853, partial [Candidatus Azotimanducaceae bacterium]
DRVMNISKRPLGVISLLAAGALLVTATSAQADTITVQSLLSDELKEQQVFASTYVTAGAGSTINGGVLAGTYVTTGVGTTIHGRTAAGTATTFGAGSIVDGAVQSGTATTLGASANVSGSIRSGTATTVGAGAIVESDDVEDGSQNSTAPLVANSQGEILKAQKFMGLFGSGKQLVPGDIAADTTFTADTYGISGLLTVAANTTITLDAQGQDSVFQFNVSNYLTFGEGATVRVINTTDAAGNAVSVSVIWNATGGYVTVGAGANIVGTILAKGHVSTGAHSMLSGPGTTCSAGVYSATSYISIGAVATVGTGSSCSAPTVPPMSAIEVPKH